MLKIAKAVDEEDNGVPINLSEDGTPKCEDSKEHVWIEEEDGTTRCVDCGVILIPQHTLIDELQVVCLDFKGCQRNHNCITCDGTRFCFCPALQNKEDFKKMLWNEK